MVQKKFVMLFLVNQIPALCAIGAAFLIRKKLLADAAAVEKSPQPDE
jgi:hypothetical protein